VVAGWAVGFVVSAMNVSFGLKAGWAQGGRWGESAPVPETKEIACLASCHERGMLRHRASSRMRGDDKITYTY